MRSTVLFSIASTLLIVPAPHRTLPKLYNFVALNSKKCQTRVSTVVVSHSPLYGDKFAEHTRLSNTAFVAQPPEHTADMDHTRFHNRDKGRENIERLPDSASLLFSTSPLIYPFLAENAGYSQASYYSSLGLFLLSLPGLWSLIKRSAKSKIVQKTFTVPGPSATEGKPPSQIAGEITSFFARNNFVVASRGEAVTFEGLMIPSRGQAAFLIFCTCISLISVALVLTITFPDVGENWYWLTALSPLAGVYYWIKASRKEQIKVKMVVADDETSMDVIVQGDDEQVDQLRKELKLMEKGMVYIKGIFEK
eukprot:c19117_g1_i1 orf=247-1170(-)